MENLKNNNNITTTIKERMKNQLKKIFFQKHLIKNIYEFLEKSELTILHFIFKKLGWKDRKKQIKSVISNFIVDFGKHSEKVKYRIDDTNLLVMTNVFNLKKDFLKNFTEIYYKDTGDILNLEKEELFEYLTVLPKNEITLINPQKEKLTTSKTLIPTNLKENNESETKDKYAIFYDNTHEDHDFDFSNKESLIERQKKILEKLSIKKEEIFFPLKFITNVSYWSIILCHGGYFSCGLFHKDKLIEHKSDHKYVIRKKAGQRQINKDKSKKVKSSIGSQIRRENEKKHQENIEYILKLNEEHLNKSDAIFLFAPGFNKMLFIGEDRPLEVFKSKIINIPYNVPRANYSTMIDIYHKLTDAYLETDVKVYSG